MTIKMIVPLEVGIVCQDITVLRPFYENVLGFHFVSEIVVGSENAHQSAMSQDGYTVVRLQTNYGERIKLIQPNTPPESPVKKPYILEQKNNCYLTFIVEDIDAAIKTLSDAGTQFMTGTQKVEVRSGVYLSFCTDPEGNILELVEYANIDAYRADLKKGGH